MASRSLRVKLLVSALFVGWLALAPTPGAASGGVSEGAPLGEEAGEWCTWHYACDGRLTEWSNCEIWAECDGALHACESYCWENFDTAPARFYCAYWWTYTSGECDCTWECTL